MIETKPHLTMIKNQLWDFSESYQKGSTILLADIERVTGITRYSGSWLHIVKNWKERMSRDRQITVFARGGSSSGRYELLTDQQVLTDYAVFQQKCSRRRIRRTLKRVRRVDDSRLTDHQRLIRAMLLNKLAAESRQITAGLKAKIARSSGVIPAMRRQTSKA